MAGGVIDDKAVVDGETGGADQFLEFFIGEDVPADARFSSSQIPGSDDISVSFIGPECVVEKPGQGVAPPVSPGVVAMIDVEE